MDNHQQPQQLDMNSVLKGIAIQTVQEQASSITIGSLLTISKVLRNHAHAAHQLTPQNFLVQPALLSEGRSLWLTRFIREVPGFYRLFITHTPGGERVYLAVAENEDDTLQTKYLKITDEMRAELDRQVVSFELAADATVELGLLFMDKPLEGFEYFTAEAKTEEGSGTAAANDAASTASTEAAATSTDAAATAAAAAESAGVPAETAVQA